MFRAICSTDFKFPSHFSKVGRAGGARGPAHPPRHQLQLRHAGLLGVLVRLGALPRPLEVLPLPALQELRDLIKRFLVRATSRRLGCMPGGTAEVKQHPWFR